MGRKRLSSEIKNALRTAGSIDRELGGGRTLVDSLEYSIRMQDMIQGEFAVELCLRSSAPSVTRGRQDAVRDRVANLASTAVVEDLTVNYWGSRVCIPGSTDGPADRCPRVVGEILDAARERDVSIAPYFRSREPTHESESSAGNSASDPTDRVLFLPVMCLLVRRDGELKGIYPAANDGDRYTVEDGLDRIAAGEDPTNL